MPSPASTSSKPKVNLRSTAVKRIMQEASELADPQEDDFVAGPLESDIFEWHVTMRGVAGSEYEGGLYHLRILLPPSYPMSAPDIMLLTPNGRFELGKKICIDGLTSFHAGSWQPAWGVRTAITGLRSFWMQSGEALSAIGALDYSKEERRRLAKLSRDWVCPSCGVANKEHLPETPILCQISTEEVMETKSEPSSVSVAMETTAALSSDVTATSREAIEDVTAIPPSVIPDPEPSLADDHHRHEARLPDIPSPQVIPVQTSIIPPLSLRPTPTTPTPVLQTSQSSPSRRPVPLWLDGALFSCIAILLALIARRMSS